MENVAFLIPTCLILGLAVTGIWLLVTTVKQFMLKRKHLPHMERVEGMVIDVERRAMGTKIEGGQKTTTYGNFPVVQFTRASGKVVTFKSESGDTSTRRTRGMKSRTTYTQYQKGDQLSVLYDPDGAIKPMIVTDTNIWMTEIFMALGGAAFLGGAVFIAAVFGGKIIEQLPF